MTAVELDLTCNTCGTRNPNADAIEEGVANGLDPDNITWLCHECGLVM